MSRPVRIANCSGFYGDRFAAAKEMLEGGPIDYLTGDYLAELTMLILSKARQKRADGGFAVTFLKQMEQVLGTAVDQRVKVVTNAGGLNPAGLADKLRSVADELGIDAKIAHIEGDDILERLDELQAGGHEFRNLDTGQSLAELRAEPLTANVYLGSWGIVEALSQGADVVVCPRVTDAAVTIGPAAYHHGWTPDHLDELAGALVAGHIIECGCQATGGNYSFFEEVPDLRHPGFPLVEVEETGEVVVTKHEGTGGLVSPGTVTAQLLYETQSPRYLSPDVTARFDTIRLAEEGPDRVRVSGVKGEPPPPTGKVCINYAGGYRNSMTFLLSGIDVEAKARTLEDALWTRVGGRDRFEEVDVTLAGLEPNDPARLADAYTRLVVTVKDQDPNKVGRAFSSAAIELGLANYPGFFTDGPPGPESPFGVYWPALLPAEEVHQVVVGPDGQRTEVDFIVGADREVAVDPAAVELPPPIEGETQRVPLGTVFGARSGDKGGNANIGVWARSDEGYVWLRDHLTTDLLRSLMPEAASLEIDRFELPNLRSLNFVVHGLLGLGVASNALIDPQAKGLGEFLRARTVELPSQLIAQDRVSG